MSRAVVICSSFGRPEALRKSRVAHADSPRRVASSAGRNSPRCRPGSRRWSTAASLADWVTRALIASLDLDGGAGLQAELGRGLARGMRRHRQIRARRDLAGLACNRTGHRGSSSWSERPDGAACRRPALAGSSRNSCRRRWPPQSRACLAFFLAASASPAGAEAAATMSASASSARPEARTCAQH